MTRLRLIAFVFGVSVLTLVVSAIPAGAGQAPPELEGAVTCSDGTYTITWTITVFGVPPGEESNLVNIQLSGAASGTVVFTPNPVPGPSPVTSQGTTTLPGSTSGDVTLTLVSDYLMPREATATVTLDGACTAPPPPPAITPAAEPVAAAPSFTG
jgi:hypothetical protein